jgi:exosortase/archaeosortase family protein
MLAQLIQSISPYCFKHFKKHENLFTFLIRLGMLVLLWQLFFHFVWHNESWLAAYDAFNLVIIDGILWTCSALLELLQYSTEVDSFNRIVKLQGTIGVTVGEPCIGYDITAFFVALIMACKGPIKQKLWYIPLGVLIIFFINLVRICALALLVTVDQAIWELNHKLIFTIVVYIFIFFLWKYWLNISRLKGYPPSTKLALTKEE